MRKYSKYIYVIAMVIVLGITVGFAALVSEMSISNIVAEIRLKKDIRVTDFSYSSSTSETSTSSVDYSNKALLTDIILPNSDSTITYKVEVTNFGNVEMGIYELTGLPENLTYEVTDYTLKEKICDENNVCASGIVKTFYLTIKYVSNGYSSTNTVYSLDMKVDFRQFYTISYDSSITNNGYQSEIISGGNLVITFTNPIPSYISIYSDGLIVDNSLYEYKNGTLKYNNISGHIVIKETKTFVSMMSNGAVSDNDIDFGSSDGLNVENNIAYVMSGTEDDEYPIYYYRGYVTKNNVIFANFCWKIVRTTETGGTKLIYNGVPASDGSCNNTGEESTIGAGVFNSDSLSPTDVGYMYGTRYESASIDLSSQSETYLYGNDISWDGTNYTLKDTISSSKWSTNKSTIATKYHYTCFNTTGVCSNVYYILYDSSASEIYYLTLSGGKNIEETKNEMYASINDSTIKSVIDNWYQANMTSYTNKLENAIWCNDRSINTGALKGKDENATDNTEFETYHRNSYSPYKPSIECTNQNDSFTLKVESGGTSGYGNNALTYPVGLLTSDELTLAGHGSRGHNYNGELNPAITKSYLYLSGCHWWTMSPRSYFEGRAYLEIMQGTGWDGISGTSVNNTYEDIYVRPAIVLKNGIEVDDGDGSSNDPYTIKVPEITFYIDNTAYKAIEGMTWEQWINSDYNSDGFSVCFSNEVCNSTLDYVMTSGSEHAPFKATRQITENYKYIVYNEVEDVPVNRTITIMVNGESTDDVDYEFDSTTDSYIFTYTGDGTLLDWEFISLVEGRDYEVNGQDDYSIEITLLDSTIFEITANAIVKI